MSNRFCWYLMPILGTMVIMQAVPIAATLALSATQVNGIAKQITVLIEGPGGNGTGVIVEKTGNTYRLLTAGHVVASINPGEEAYAITSDQQKHTIDTNNIKIISGVDLAIVEFVSDRSYSSAKLGNGERLSEGMNVYVAGFPLPTTAIDRSVYTFVPGKITSASSQGLRDGYGLIYNNDTLPGMSGGPVLNEQGEVIAIHGRADTTQTQATGYDNIYIKTGLNLGIPLSNNVLGGVNPSPSPLPSSPPTSVSPTPPPSASSLPPPPPQTALQSPPEIIIDPMDNSVDNSVVPPPSTLISQTTGVDYTSLQDLLKAGQWEKADQRTYDLMVMAGDEDNSGAITSTELEDIACEDLQTIDRLWLEYSQGKFGLSVQKRIYESFGNVESIDVDAYRQFSHQVGWVEGGSPDDPDYYFYDDLNFSLSAPQGHLPRWSWGLNIAVVYSRMSYLTKRLADCDL